MEIKYGRKAEITPALNEFIINKLIFFLLYKFVTCTSLIDITFKLLGN
jgi:hypothetical protein